MKIPDWLPTYGDLDFRGDCPKEVMEQVTLIAEIRKRWPNNIGRVAMHPRNEGKRDWRQASRHAAEGLTKGASDLIIPGNPALVLELKRKDQMKGQLSESERHYLMVAKAMGCRVGVAFGHEAALEAVEEWWEDQKH